MPDLAAFDAAPFPIAIHQDLKVVYLNPAMKEVFRRAGYSLDDLRRMDLFDLAAPEDRDAAWANYQRLMHDGRRCHAVTRTFVTRDGRRILAVASVARSEWEGRPAIWIGMLWAEGTTPAPAAGPAASVVLTDDVPARQQAVLSLLSPRERQVAVLVAAGETTARVAALLQVEAQTVRDHLKSIFRRLDVHSRVELTRLLHGLD